MIFLYISLAAFCDGHLLVYSETHLDVFNTQTAEWVQSIGLKRSRPLNNQGNISMTFVNESPLVIYLANMHTSGWSRMGTSENVKLIGFCFSRGVDQYQLAGRTQQAEAQVLVARGWHTDDGQTVQDDFGTNEFQPYLAFGPRRRHPEAATARPAHDHRDGRSDTNATEGEWTINKKQN